MFSLYSKDYCNGTNGYILLNGMEPSVYRSDGNIKPCCRFVMPKGVRNNIKKDKSQEVFLGAPQAIT